MKAYETNLQGILNSPNQYIIPVFQRFYSWEKGNWEQLWSDVLGLLEADSDGSSTTHFMGTLVFVPEPLYPNHIPAFQVIDGQQRLITISLLLCALRDLAGQMGFGSLSDEIQNTYLVHQYRKGREYYRVFPRHRDRQDYENAISKREDVHNRVLNTIEFFKGQIQSLPGADSEEGLRNFLGQFTSRLEFVHITLNHENPYRIFKSLNSTGVDLSEGDLIRNYVFMHVLVDDQDAFDEALWRPLEKHFEDKNGNLGGALFTQFLRDFLMKDGKYVPAYQIFQFFEQKYPSESINPETLTQDLTRFAKFYDEIRGVKEHPDQDVRVALNKIRVLDNSTAYPLLLRLMHLQVNGILSKDDLAQCVEFIASFIFRRFICKESERAYNRWFVAACSEAGSDTLHHLIDFLSSKGFPSDERFEANFISNRIYGSHYDRVILEAIENSFGHKEPVDLSSATVEHILPQTLTDSWRNDLGENADHIHETWLHTIGNLSLTGYNSEISNSPFSKKKLEYKKSNIQLTRAIADKSQWTETEIQERGLELAKIAEKIWICPRCSTPVAAMPPAIQDSKPVDTDVNLDAVKFFLTRRPSISENQKCLLQVLYTAGEAGMPKPDLKKAVGMETASFSAFLGGIGLRCNGTPGFNSSQGILNIIEIRSDCYFLKPLLRQAIEETQIFQSQPG